VPAPCTPCWQRVASHRGLSDTSLGGRRSFQMRFALPFPCRTPQKPANSGRIDSARTEARATRAGCSATVTSRGRVWRMPNLNSWRMPRVKLGGPLR